MAWLKCPQCANVVDVPEGQQPACNRCGFGRPQPAAQAPPDPWGSPAGSSGSSGSGATSGASGPTPPPSAWGSQTSYTGAGPQVHVYNQYQGQGKPPVSQAVAIVALLLNILIWPGLGSLIAGEQVGWAQGFLMLGGVFLAIILIGIPMMLGAWIWGIITGVELLRRSESQPRAPAY